MSKQRVTTDDQCRELALWYGQERTVRGKARELGISVAALYDSIARGNQLPTAAARFKTRDYVLKNHHAEGGDIHIEIAPRETPQSESNEQ